MQWASPRKQQACQRASDVYSTPRLYATQAYAGYKYKPARVSWLRVVAKALAGAAVLAVPGLLVLHNLGLLVR